MRPTIADSNAVDLNPQRWSGATIFLICAAFLAGPAYNVYLHYDFSHSTDSQSYVRIAAGDFDVSVTHRYRVVVPFLAGAVKFPIEQAFGFIWPHRDVPGHHVRIGFFLVNLVLMSLVGLVLFRVGQAYDLSPLAAGVAVAAYLASRWANYLAALPLVDSFHILCVAITFLALRTKSGRLLTLAILLGPISKESFIFIAPLTLLFGNLRIWQQLVLYAVSACAVVAIHLAIDAYQPIDAGSIRNAFEHLNNVGYSIRRFLSPAGMGEVFSVLGFFNLLWLAGLTRTNRRDMFRAIDLPLWLLLASVIVQALISTSLARMLFVAGPFWVVLLGSAVRLLQAPSVTTPMPVSMPLNKAA